MKWPSFVVIGAQKSASSLLDRRLEAHPDVWMPPNEEPAFEDPYYADGGLTRMGARLAQAPPTAVVGIKRPDYLAKPRCAERIALHVPDAKLLVILRDPVDRAVSAYYHYMRYGRIPVRPIDKGMAALLDGAHTRGSRDREILDFGRYGAHLRRWFEHFDRGQVLALLTEELTEGDAGYVRAQRFLGLTPWDDAPPTPAVNVGVYSIPRLRFRAMLRPVFRSPEDPVDSPTASVLDGPRRLLLDVEQRVFTRFFPDERPQLSEEVRTRLREYYAEDVRALEQLLARDLHHWAPRALAR